MLNSLKYTVKTYTVAVIIISYSIKFNISGNKF